MELEKQLREEIKKWSSKLDANLSAARPIGEKGVEFLTNIKAYQSDSLHFMEKKDLVRSFEALIWAWSWMEIGRQMEILS